MAQITTVSNGYEITNPELAKATKRIVSLAEKIKSNYFAIGLELINIRDNKLYESAPEAELQSFIGFCEGVLCLSRATTYRIIATTEKVFIPLQGEHGDILKLPDVALSKLTTLDSPADIIDFVETAEITADMTVKEVDRRLKEYRKAKIVEVDNGDIQQSDTNATIETHDTEVRNAEETSAAIRQDMIDNSTNYPSEDTVVSETNDDEFATAVYVLLSEISERWGGDKELKDKISKFLDTWYD